MVDLTFERENYPSMPAEEILKHALKGQHDSGLELRLKLAKNILEVRAADASVKAARAAEAAMVEQRRVADETGKLAAETKTLACATSWMAVATLATVLLNLLPLMKSCGAQDNMDRAANQVPE